MRLQLPRPPSVNNLFINVPKRGRVPSPAYRRWRAEAEAALWLVPAHQRKPVHGPVRVGVTVEDKGRFDLDNICKALLDFAVHFHLIDGDDRSVVRKITLAFGPVEGALVIVEKHE